MRKLLSIFDATVGYVKPIVAILTLITFIYGTILVLYLRYDYCEVKSRNQVLTQQKIVELYYETSQQDKETRTDFLVEQKRLIEYKGDYDNLRETWLGNLFLGSREPVKIIVITSEETKAKYHND